MDLNALEIRAQQLVTGKMSLREFVDQFAGDSVAETADATLDLDRERRCGFPEVVYGHGKSVDSLKQIFARLLDAGVEVLATRIAAEKATALAKHFDALRYNELARTIRINLESVSKEPPLGHVAIVTAGTSDLPVAEEARETLDWMNVSHEVITDVGVAGPQRLLAEVEQLRKADAVVVIAGMEGALPSVVGGHVAVPVIAVPTSVGYGASFGGLAALLSMLNSCAANVTVVNIDAGFKAAYVAGLIAKRGKRIE